MLILVKVSTCSFGVYETIAFFFMNSMYNFLVNNGVKVSQKIWHMKLPPKIKIFLRYLKRGSF